MDENAKQEIPEGWRHQNDRLERDFVFKDFVAAFGFMTQVAMLAEVSDHHPNWSNVYNHVNVALTTHDAGNVVTARDISFAHKINEIELSGMLR